MTIRLELLQTRFASFVRLVKSEEFTSSTLCKPIFRNVLNNKIPRHAELLILENVAFVWTKTIFTLFFQVQISF